MKFLKTICAFSLSLCLLLSGCSQTTSPASSSELSSSLPEVVVERPANSESPIESEFISSSSEVPSSTPSTAIVSKTPANIASLDATSIIWGPGNNKNTEGRPTTPVDLQKKYGHLGAYFIIDSGSEVYLTFDEGYENGYTPAILDTLKAKNVKAVFFVTMPFAKENPALIQRIIDEGHIVGNHSVNHKDMTTLDEATATSEIMDLHHYIKENFGYEMWLFRPPAGAFSEKSLGITHNCGYISVFWSFAYRDWVTDDQMTTTAAMAKLSDNLYGGALYLLHAVSPTNTTILGDFIDTAEQNGLNFGDFSTLPDPYISQ